MDLRTFITETLCQISDGMIDAQAALKDKGVRVNPPYTIDIHGNFQNTEKNTNPNFSEHFQVIDFDIALTVTDDKKSSGGMMLSVLAAKLGGSVEKDQSTAAVSRVQFRIAALLPQCKFEDAKK